VPARSYCWKTENSVACQKNGWLIDHGWPHGEEHLVTSFACCGYWCTLHWMPFSCSSCIPCMNVWVCCNGHRELLVQAMVHSYISINSSYTYVFGGVGTKLDIKCYNDFFLTCVEMIAGPSILQRFIFSLPFSFWIYSNKVTVVYTLLLKLSQIMNRRMKFACHLYLIADSGLWMSFIHNPSFIHMYTIWSFIILHFTSSLHMVVNLIIEMFVF